MVSDEELKLLKSKVQEKNVFIGARSILRALRSGSIGTIYLARNCQPQAALDIQRYASLVPVDVIALDMDNEELGIFCKKNYFISTIALRS